MLTSQTGDGIYGSSNSLIPIGVVQNMSLTSSRSVMKLFEIGSMRSYQIPGRLMNQLTMTRLLMYGPSLLRVLYAQAPERLVGLLGTPLNVDPDSSGRGVAPLASYDALYPQGTLRGIPGYGGLAGENNRDLWVNIHSEIFQIPIGLAVIHKGANDAAYGGYYIEDFMIESHQMGFDSGSTVMSEAVSGIFDRLEPIQLVARPINNN